jgi:hypothetical protein
MHHASPVWHHRTKSLVARSVLYPIQMIHPENTVEPLRGHPLGERVLARQAELEGAVEDLDEGTPEYVAIDTALATVEQFLGADMEHLSDATARDHNNWLERNKYHGTTNDTKAKRVH